MEICKRVTQNCLAVRSRIDDTSMRDARNPNDSYGAGTDRMSAELEIRSRESIRMTAAIWKTQAYRPSLILIRCRGSQSLPKSNRSDELGRFPD